MCEREREFGVRSMSRGALAGFYFLRHTAALPARLLVITVESGMWIEKERRGLRGTCCYWLACSVLFSAFFKTFSYYY